MPGVLKRLLIGKPLKTAASAEERLDKRTALAVFSSDALSSVAYATEEILFVLVLAGGGALGASIPVALAIVALLAIVVLSYGQTIRAYPTGGGAYIVAKENLGVPAGLVAGASLLLDYVLTVAVSVTAGVAAVTSAVPSLAEHRVVIAVAAIAFIAIVNLRGIRASGKAFAVPTYFFIASLAWLIVDGLWQTAGQAPSPSHAAGAEPLTAFLVLRAFAAGCTALTGVEAISNGVPAFKSPEARNARKTLYAMGAILAAMFAGVTWLAHVLGIVPAGDQTVVSQIAHAVFGAGPAYYAVQAATALILLFAANTSFADFPRLASLLARDRFLPVQLADRGDRLVYSNGIVLLAVASAALIFVFGGETHALIPLYAVGVFIGFSLSQAGMVRKWLAERGEGWRRHMAMNAVGGVTTFAVLVVIAATKFAHGAWAVLVAIPTMVAAMYGVRRHYATLKTRLSLEQEREAPVPADHVVVLFIGTIHKGTVAAARYAKALGATKIKAIHVSMDESDAADIRGKWDRWGMDIPLIIAPSPYRHVVDILMHYIREIERQNPDATVSVILPEFICPHWWQLLLHTQTAAWLKLHLLREHVSVITVPIQLM